MQNSLFLKVVFGLALMFAVPVWLFLHYGYIVSPSKVETTASGTQDKTGPSTKSVTSADLATIAAQAKTDTQLIIDSNKESIKEFRLEVKSQMDSMEERQQSRDAKQDERMGRLEQHLRSTPSGPTSYSAGDSSGRGRRVYVIRAH